ncbi:MAG: DUF5615 family PIN-like protein [Magnetococcales bacterium]|nr:DUF5615 family PIN-like protein [Magnetococcales bacterium]MBF0149017.1 DUF5615 family PIN-like protein [Magnetococcales bacterium]MBF0346179.1 DUF5615 family PIN-like protein [Magnetococcales bacterium]MBF0630329.1 DUF5615 family PIN-like protein [Magnetococcales bacterium]
MDQASDRDIWNYAKAYDFIIVTRDADFLAMSILFGAPPPVICLHLPNPSWKEAGQRLLGLGRSILESLEKGEISFVEVSP